eukprot:364334-Chlamydomonas_euryale.AAC.3
MANAVRQETAGWHIPRGRFRAMAAQVADVAALRRPANPSMERHAVIWRGPAEPRLLGGGGPPPRPPMAHALWVQQRTEASTPQRSLA